MNRRRLLRGGAALAAATGIPAAAQALPMLDPFAPDPAGPWRTYELTTRIELVNASGPAKVWVPVPAFAQPSWIRPVPSRWTTNAGTAALYRDPGTGTQMVYAQWPSVAAVPTIEIVGRAAVRDRSVDLKKPTGADLIAADRLRYTAPTALLPTDGIVKATADKITSGAAAELAKARAIYEWVVTNTFIDPKAAGCGTGDIKAMLAGGSLGGGSADINGLFTGLARAAGLPARVLYGIRTGPSAFGYTSLGPAGPDVTTAQHCRAEVFLTGFGWVPADPADVRRVILAEPPGHLALDNVLVTDARTTLFGAWESNWVAYNDGHDIALPGSSGAGTLGFLVYPQAETGGVRRDPLAPAAFRYTIAARQLP